MNKKLISALFVGALLLGSTSALTSCKDYDDDINDLQAQIDKAALASDVAALKTQLSAAQATASAAKSTADQALASAKAANDALALKAAQTDLDAAVKRIAALETEMSKLNDFEAKLQASVDSELASLKTQFETLKTEILNSIGSMVTEVELWASYWGNNQQVGNLIGYRMGTYNLALTNGTEQSTSFGDKTDPAGTPTTTYTKGNVFSFKSGLIVRVNPTNAELTPDNIKLINSKGIDLNKYIKIESVDKYDGLLTAITRGASTVGNGTGLWKIQTKLVEGCDVEAFQKEIMTVNEKKDSIYTLYAVAINNTTDTTRSVVSSYDVAVTNPAYKADADLEFTVDGTAVAAIHNRYLKSESLDDDGNVAAWNEGNATKYTELIWTADKTNPLVYGKYCTEATAGKTVQGDDRNKLKALPVNAGTPFTIHFPEVSKAQYYYVTLDKPCANQSQDSEWAAWTKYQYEGLNTRTEATSDLSITITGVNHDIIGFRVYAVNYNGTLVDPDGKAFYVEVGKAATTAVVAANITATTNLGTAYTTNYAIVPITDVTFQSLTTTLSGTNVVMYDGTTKTGNEISWQLFKDAKGTAATNWKDAKYIGVCITSDATKWTDGKTLSTTIEGKNASDNIVNTINLTVTKIIPTTIPDGFSWKDKQLVDGVFTCYVDPEVGTNATAVWTTLDGTVTNGYKNLNSAVNGLKDLNYEFTFAKAAKTDGKLTDLVVKAKGSEDYPLHVAKEFVDGSEHATTISYVYKNVSSNKDDANVAITAASVTTKFECVLNTTLQTYAWTQAPAVTNTDKTVTPAKDMNFLDYGVGDQFIAAKFLKGTNSFDGMWTGTFDTLAKYYTVKSAKLTSDANTTEDYFTVTYETAPGALVPSDANLKPADLAAFKFTPKGGTTNPKAVVASTLTVTLTDAFGHDNVYTLKVTINPR